MIAVDSSVLIDVLIGDTRYADTSETRITEALSMDDVVVCDAVIAEVQAMLGTSASVMDPLETLGIRYEPTTVHAAVRAGHMHRRFRSRGGKRERVVADFLIGAHALLQCSGLITRDAGFFSRLLQGLEGH